MLETDCRVDVRDGVALVASVVENAAPTPRRVRVVPLADGDVLPPRRRGVPESGWRGDAYETTVPPGDSLAVGFACREPAADPPVEVVDEGRPAGDEGDDAETPSTLLRRLGSPAPPRDAVPDGAGDGGPGAPAAVGGAVDAGTETDVPSPVAAWFDQVADRVARAERLAAARDLDAAASAVADADGLAGVERLLATLSDDAAALRAVADRAESLANDCAAVEAVPVEAYRRLA